MQKNILLPISLIIICSFGFTKPMENAEQSKDKKEKELLSLMITIYELRDSIIHSANELKYLYKYEDLLNEYEDLIDKKNALIKTLPAETIEKIIIQAQARFEQIKMNHCCILF